MIYYLLVKNNQLDFTTYNNQKSSKLCLLHVLSEHQFMNTYLKGKKKKELGISDSVKAEDFFCIIILFYVLKTLPNIDLVDDI